MIKSRRGHKSDSIVALYPSESSDELFWAGDSLCGNVFVREDNILLVHVWKRRLFTLKADRLELFENQRAWENSQPKNVILFDSMLRAPQSSYSDPIELSKPKRSFNRIFSRPELYVCRIYLCLTVIFRNNELDFRDMNESWILHTKFGFSNSNTRDIFVAELRKRLPQPSTPDEEEVTIDEE